MKPKANDEILMGRIRANEEVAALFECLPLSAREQQRKTKAPTSFTLLHSVSFFTSSVIAPAQQLELLLTGTELDADARDIVNATMEMMQQYNTERWERATPQSSAARGEARRKATKRKRKSRRL